jgi:hypothetical protein
VGDIQAERKPDLQPDREFSSSVCKFDQAEKQGRKVEFGRKCSLDHVSGFLFLDCFGHEADHKAELTVAHLVAYHERFGMLPPYFAADQKHGNQITGND